LVYKEINKLIELDNEILSSYFYDIRKENIIQISKLFIQADKRDDKYKKALKLLYDNYDLLYKNFTQTSFIKTKQTISEVIYLYLKEINDLYLYLKEINDSDSYKYNIYISVKLYLSYLEDIVSVENIKDEDFIVLFDILKKIYLLFSGHFDPSKVDDKKLIDKYNELEIKYNNLNVKNKNDQGTNIQDVETEYKQYMLELIELVKKDGDIKIGNKNIGNYNIYRISEILIQE